MTQPSSDNVYVSITFGNIPRALAEQIANAAEDTAKGYDISVDFGTPIGADDPTPVADEAADATGGDPTVDVTPSDPVAPDAQPTPAPVVPDAQPTPVTIDNDSGVTVTTVDPNTPDQASGR